MKMLLILYCLIELLHHLKVLDEPDVDSKLSNLLSNDVVVSTLPNLPLIVVISLSKEPVLVSNVVNLVFWQY